MSPDGTAAELTRQADEYIASDDAAARWAAGYGRIQHDANTRARVVEMALALRERGVEGDAPLFDVLHAADRVASAAMWLVVHMTYAARVRLDGGDLAQAEFKRSPEGHTGGALNMVPAYTGYLAANAICGITRSWLMGQGHTVAAIDAVNLLVGNMTPEHAARYDLTDEGLTLFVRDFYRYEIGPDGQIVSPLGSHVNVHTAGGMAEGGYLGFTELQYVHMPLPGERLVTFLSDGAFEEQRGSDWAPRWWRAEDCGYPLPIMIANGRRIDQRTTIAQRGGVSWLEDHLRLNTFDPFSFDGRDPAAFAWAIWRMERDLEERAAAVARGEARYPVPIPYGIAVAPKGAGFYGEGTNLAHNLPLPGSPRDDAESARIFNEHARRLFVPLPELRQGITRFSMHARSARVRERDHPIAHRQVEPPSMPPFEPLPVPASRADEASWRRVSAMAGVDSAFVNIVRANPHLRPRVGNPDEMRSNRMLETLEYLKFRVTDPEPGIPEDVFGAVITALNEEAVVSAALANKGGIGITVTYEAFAPKMFGVMRQDITWSASLRDHGRPGQWLSLPLVLTSHTWENAKNEMSHQDPSMAESLLGERSDISRVVFPPDYNSAAITVRYLYRTHGEYWALVVAKTPAPSLCTPEDCHRMLAEGAIALDWLGYRPDDATLIITATGAFHLHEVIRASRRLTARDVPHRAVYMFEPARFRAPRARGEALHAAPRDVVGRLYPAAARHRLFVTHIRPETALGIVSPLHTGKHTAGLGFIGRGGTLDVPGMLFINRCSWAHIVRAAARLLGIDERALLDDAEIDAIDGRRAPHGVIY